MRRGLNTGRARMGKRTAVVPKTETVRVRLFVLHDMRTRILEGVSMELAVRPVRLVRPKRAVRHGNRRGGKCRRGGHRPQQRTKC